MLLQQCHPNSAGPSLLLEERGEIPIVLLFLLCCRLLPKPGETAKVYRIEESKNAEYIHNLFVQVLRTAYSINSSKHE